MILLLWLLLLLSFFLLLLICRRALLNVIWSSNWDNMLEMFGCLPLRSNYCDSLSPSGRLLGVGLVLCDLNHIICCSTGTVNPSGLCVLVRAATLLLQDRNHIVYIIGRRLSWAILILLSMLLLLLCSHYCYVLTISLVSCLRAFQQGIWTLHRHPTLITTILWGSLLSSGNRFLAWVTVVYQGSGCQLLLLPFVLFLLFVLRSNYLVDNEIHGLRNDVRVMKLVWAVKGVCVRHFSRLFIRITTDWTTIAVLAILIGLRRSFSARCAIYNGTTAILNEYIAVLQIGVRND